MKPMYLVAKPHTFFRDKNLSEQRLLYITEYDRSLLVVPDTELQDVLSECVPRDAIGKEIEKLPELRLDHNWIVKIEDAEVDQVPGSSCFVVTWFDMYEPDVIMIFQINWLSEKYQKNAPEKTRKWIARLYEEASRWKVLE